MYLHQTPMFHAASMGGVLGIPAAGATSTFIPLFDPAAVLDVDRARRGHHDRDGADDDRHAAAATPSFRPERLASLRDADLRRVAHAGRAARAAARAVPRPRHLPGLRHDRELRASLTMPRPRRAPRGRRAACARPGGPLPGVVLSIQDDEGNEPARRARPARCAPAAATSCASTGTSPRPPPRRSAAAGTTPATPATSTTQGYLFLVDRVKDMIVTGGENVYSVEVENAIATHPAVAQVAVIGIPERAVGRGRARHRRAAADGVDRHRGRDHRRTPGSGSPATRCPSRSSSAPSRCPLSGAMKVLKRDLRAPYWEGHDRGVG